MEILITGANKGIGFAIVQRLLIDKRVSKIVFTSRDIMNAEKALKEFEFSNPNKVKIGYLELDLLDESSMNHFVNTLISENHSYDVILHNAGVLFPRNLINKKVVDVTLRTNLISPMKLSKIFIDEKILNPNGKLIFISSSLGSLNRIKKHAIIYDQLSKFKDKNFGVENLQAVIDQYANEIMDFKLSSKWPTSVYAVSKLFLTIFATCLSHSPNYSDYKFYSCCPGWCQTDLTHETKAEKTAYQGAETPTFLALEEQLAEMNGRFFFDLKALDI
jgi:NAD(P)-dependent dehydrogenase (short-subunit alcohol dehydrogenase family)